MNLELCPAFNIAFICIYVHIIMVKSHKAVYRLVTAPQGDTQKYTLAFAYDSPRWLVK